MKMKPPYALVVAFLLSLMVGIPEEAWTAPQAVGQRAGEVSRVIPAVSIARGPKTITASAKSVVDWQDLVNTHVNARARIALDDGSVLNVGSESSIKVVKHDTGAQQTELELTYGKLRTQAQKIAKPDGKFEVRTPAGVAGVVGTDFFIGYDNTAHTMSVVVFEGLVKVCNLAGICVIVKAGQMTSVREGDNSAPLLPIQVPLDVLVAASKDTELSGPRVLQATHHIGKGTGITLGILAAVPAVVVPIVATRGGGAPPVQTGCKPTTGQPCP
jgi:hypothetical protein